MANRGQIDFQHENVSPKRLCSPEDRLNQFAVVTPIYEVPRVSF